MKALRAAMADYAAIHSHVVQDVLARLDKTYHAFFRRVATGEKPGFPRFHGRNRYRSCTDKEYGNGARLDNGSLVLSTIGCLAVRWSRPVAGAIKSVTISKDADGWYVSFSCAEVPTQPVPLTDKETGIDVGPHGLPGDGGGRGRRAPPPPAHGAAAPREGRPAVRQAVSARAASAARLPPQGGAGARARV
jgi:putative transposase